jgi:hypothetical protein
MTGIEHGHITISIPADIWPDMKAEYTRLCSKRSVVAIRYLGKQMVELVIGDDGKVKLVTSFI